MSKIDKIDEIVELHFQVLKTQLILELMVQRTENIYKITDSDIREIENRAINTLNKKFPTIGITIERNK